MAHHTDANKLSEKELERKERRHIRRKWHWGTLRHTLLVIFTLLIAVIATVVMVAGQYFLGPSQAASDKLTQTLHQSSALKFIPYLFLYEHVGEALERGETLSPDDVTDSSLVTVVARQPKEYASDAAEQEQFDENGIRLVEVNGATYHGYMMIVQDPSRVKLGVCATPFSDARPGRRVDEIMKDYGAIAGMNGGAFHDSNGSGTGGLAEGMVISEGKLLRHVSKTYAVVAGFDQNDILHVGKFTEEQAKKIGLRDACAFGPALVVNGEPAMANDKGLNPRSAIGQRADGAVLMLVIDGRQANSLGATLSDVIEVMLDFGAVNACNMDGGSSTIMYYGDEKINDGMTITVSRRMPTAWIVK